MRTPTLQYLYLQKPVTMMVVICIISVLPWIGLGDFSTKGEPREAAVAISMLETGNWVLPQSYANEFAFKPPMAHWLMAAFSYPQGYVSEFPSRLPSALAFITLIGFVLVFFGKRIVKFQEAFIATLLLLIQRPLCLEKNLSCCGYTDAALIISGVLFEKRIQQNNVLTLNVKIKDSGILLTVWIPC